MERTGYEYQVLTEVRITRGEVLRLIELSKRHYDHACRALSRPGPGAHLHGWLNQFESLEGDPNDSTDVQIDLRTLDILCKVTEDEDVDSALVAKLWELARTAGKEYRRVNGLDRPDQTVKPTEAHLVIKYLRDAGWAYGQGEYPWTRGDLQAMSADDALSYEFLERRLVFKK